MQALCQWDVQRDESPESLDDFLTADQPPTAVVAYARQLVQAYWEHRQSIDDRLTAAAVNWSLSRMSPVERNAMRLAVVELLEEAVPAKVALDEAIEIGRAYGGKDSPRFINGVLDLVMQRLNRTRTGDH
jgi:N utilization substance protein B